MVPAGFSALIFFQDRGEETIAQVQAGDGAQVGAASEIFKIGPEQRACRFEAIEFVATVE